MFVHISAVEHAGMRNLIEGQKISFDVEADRRSGTLFKPLVIGACGSYAECPLWRSGGNFSNDREGRKTERPVLRAMALPRDVIWPKPASLLISPHIGRADVKPQRVPTHVLRVGKPRRTELELNGP